MKVHSTILKRSQDIAFFHTMQLFVELILCGSINVQIIAQTFQCTYRLTNKPQILYVITNSKRKEILDSI